ncbi:3-dehydroquinate synthase [Pedobacter gandavensis]|uniref:3-dehydroquinate synthase n=1 Tax=Pedobacter gandavensis TaxID=2679963 RepID=UPI00247A2613|nr:3-dehydroquinate synthase [Pedobacter gandavensis]WGQ11328.1 3-dehydroquinate synthase [Pedobacter gandavensis]
MYKAQTIQQHFQVDYQYPVIFTRNIFYPGNLELIQIIKSGSAKAVLVIENTLLISNPELVQEINYYFKHHKFSCQVLLMEGGEGIKNNPARIEEVLTFLDTHQIDRHSYLIAIGGGALLDAVGYAGAIAHRGIRLIRVPTTVLSQNDSGVGVKNSVNYFGKKNFLGTFSPPYAVINDSVFLESLDGRNWRSGIAEAVKVALIKDEFFFDWITENIEELNNRDMGVMEQLIFRCAQLHVAHIGTAGDPFEKGSSRPLDFGHWAAHKLEYLTGYQLLHGEAVAIGIALDTVYSGLSGRLNSMSVSRVLHCLNALGFDIFHPLLLAENGLEINAALYQGLEEFREHLGGELTIMLLAAIGKGEEVHEMHQHLLSDAAQYLFKFQFQVQEAPVLIPQMV